MEAFARLLRAARANLGIPLSIMILRLPEWAPRDPATLCRYEHGHVPPLQILFALAIAYGIGRAELLKALAEDFNNFPGFPS